MEYYKQVNASGETIAVYSAPDGTDIPVGARSIDGVEYQNAIVDFGKADAEVEARRKADADAKLKAEQEAVVAAEKENAEKEAEEAEKRRAEQEAAEKEWQERQDAINDYASKIKAGTAKLDDVPEEYRGDVDYIVNPPVTTTQLDKRLEAAESAVDFLMTTIAETSAQ